MIFTAQPKQGFGVRCNGLTVTKVTGGSQAERLGVQEGDVIVKISGKTMANVKEITNSLSEGKMGQNPYEVEIKRSGSNLRNCANGLAERAAAGAKRKSRLSQAGMNMMNKPSTGENLPEKKVQNSKFGRASGPEAKSSNRVSLFKAEVYPQMTHP